MLQGPILGGTFGYVIGNRDLARLGLKNELIGLGLCLLFGTCFAQVEMGDTQQVMSVRVPSSHN